ncbi:signal peptidase I [Acutalibacter sp. 1XD8-36]|uniref:signal peptidase I n=1 Tax=Acutalibacter sp. 1XD8-36 TaxID=2320852 RepID=UPI001412B609|nr:signal peptidase I [Acutalibacter sp. 1XD8-36]NBJ88250.1 signal peptidase I [Acutalibacter sp. 1XD8-36]
MKGKELELPTIEQIEAELKKENNRKEYNRVLRSTIFVLLVVTAAAVIVAVLMFPVLEIKGEAMNTTLRNGDFVVTGKASEYQRGDIVAFYYNNTLLVKRIIAKGGDEVDIDGDGNVTVNGQAISEPYVTEKTLGESNVTFPYSVPQDEFFVLGDNRAQSVDSRNTALGAVTQDLIVGKLLFRVWPITAIGGVK